MESETYEEFRTKLALNLCSVLPEDQLTDVLRAVDASLIGYEISLQRMELITTEGQPEVVKLFIASKAVSNLSRKTLKQYSYKLVNFFNIVRKSYMDVTANDIRMYLYQYKTEHNASDRYLDNIRITLNGFFAWLVKNGYITRNPCDTVEHIKFQVKPRAPLTPYELEVLRWNTVSIREKALIDFFFSTGCRVSECADVRLSDIDWEHRSVRIRHGKGNKERVVYFNSESELTLRKYLETRTDDTDALFVSIRSPHKALTDHALENIVKKVAKRSGLHVYPHRLRHTFATLGLRGGIPLEQLQALLGHERPETTMIYAKIDVQDLQREHQKIFI